MKIFACACRSRATNDIENEFNLGNLPNLKERKIRINPFTALLFYVYTYISPRMSKSSPEYIRIDVKQKTTTPKILNQI